MKKNTLKNIYKKITAPFRLLPAFIIIGAQKGGTSSLFSYLKQHPLIQLPDLKEIHFFDKNYLKGTNWYRGHFPLRNFKNKLTGEASPYYLFHPHVPKRIYQLCPKVKLIVMLRNPVDRAYSHYMMQKKRMIDPLNTFEEALKAEESRTKAEILRMDNEPFYNSENFQRLSYLERGKYYSQLTRWLKYFSIDQFLFIKSEDFFDDPMKVLITVHHFLKVKSIKPPSLTPQNTNEYEPMSTKTRNYLNHYFAEENKKLVGLLGDNFLWKR